MYRYNLKYNLCKLEGKERGSRNKSLHLASLHARFVSSNHTPSPSSLTNTPAVASVCCLCLCEFSQIPMLSLSTQQTFTYSISS